MAEAASVLIPQIHHEKQESGSMLCAQHALNALLQGNYYDPSQLSEIAKQLDVLEHSQVDEETWRARGEDASSHNMDDTGYFSVSVLENALEVWGLRLVRWRSQEMQALQDKPEEQLAFVLNLESHWFTIRSFTGGYWFNLNSFLEKPSWVGSSYLGALLNAAETEGYSVFVVRAAADHAIGNMRSSAADECAATLPSASELADQVSTSQEAQVNAPQGLRPTASKTLDPAERQGEIDEDADIQAALQASLADAAISTSSNEGQGASSRMQSPSIVGQRRSRMGPADPENIDDEEETDAHVDAIAPSRRRARAMPQTSTSSAAPSARNSHYVLPTASGGRRRTSRRVEDGESIQQRTAALTGGDTHENAISVDDDSFLSAAPRHDGAISIDDDEDEDEGDDVAQLRTAASSAPRSPFLDPAIFNAGAGSSNNSDDDFHSLSNDEGGLGESVMQHDIDAVRRHAAMRPTRDYDDEDSELQAALAASMRGADSSEGIGRAGGESGYLDDVSAADWLNEEDARAIREAQASFGGPAIGRVSSEAMARSTSSRTTPPPADVERIARMRAEAQRKAREEEEARERGIDPSVKESAVGASSGPGAQSSEEDEDSSDDEAPQISPEEMRRARLARFGG